MKKVGSQIKSPHALRPSPELNEFQPYMPISAKDLQNLKEDILNSGEVRDPIKVYYSKEREFYLILCGYNRWQIASDHELETVPVDIYEGTADEYRELVVYDNRNRRHLNSQQKGKLIEYYLKKEPESSDRSIGKKASADGKTVAKARKKLESTEEIPQLDNTVGQDGKKRKKPATKKRKAPAGNKQKDTPELDRVKAEIKALLGKSIDPKWAGRELMNYIKKTAKL